jgi:hypothetical protein
MKSLARFKWSIIMAILGFVLFVIPLVLIFTMLKDKGTSFLGPGNEIITITEPGEYTLWIETKSIIKGQYMTFSNDLPPGTVIKVSQMTTGALIPFQSAGSSSMESNGIKRISLGNVQLDHPGKYEIAVSGLIEKRAFYLDKNHFLQFFMISFASAMLGFLSFFISFGLAIYAIIQIAKTPAPKKDEGA